MKKITAKAFALFVLIFSIVFGGLSIATPLFSSPVYAVPEDPAPADTPAPANPTPEDTPTTEETTPSDSPNTSDTDEPSTEDTDQPATEDENQTKDKDKADEEKDPATTNTCTDQAGSLSWIVCPATQLIGGAVDTIYSIIQDLLIVQPLSMENGSPIYTIWQYVLNLTNTVFVIFLLIVIVSQITGIGISNYGIKRALPKLIVAIIMMNLSFLICTLAVDASNLIGYNLREFFQSIQTDMLASVNNSVDIQGIGFDTLIAAIISGTAIGGLAIGAVGGLGTLFWMLVPVLIGALVAVVTGLITIAARQALVALLVMVAPLAFATCLLPNTEKLFTQWKNLLVRMLIFYPAFSFLYGASQLVGWALIASAKNGFGVILGLAVQVFPLFFSWSLMKMSGTVLGTLNSALRSIAKPAQNAGSRWATEHAEQRRQNYIGQNEVSSGARLRRYLDYRRTLRLNDTKNAAEIRQDRAIESAMKTSASVLGRDDQGNMKWTVNPNRYTRTAKSASYHHTLASNANAVYQNTLSGYGRHFTDNWSSRISYDHAEAFADSMAQRFLAANEAEADQKWLLNQYLDAKTNLKHNSYQYNRLIKDAAGGLGHNGESSIMGQVIIGNSTIENRRRSEARVMINKFGMEKHKQQLRWMVLDKKVNDDGFAVDERNQVIEDDQYNLLPGKHYVRWGSYIGVHKTTGNEITKEQYDALSDDERKQYNKVKYFDITNDKQDDVQRVFEDDAGYMKEILTDDVFIADPIAQRFLAEIYISHNPNKSDGKLRKYHSTIRTAVDNGGISGHGAGITPLLTSAANAGILDSMGQFNITTLQSLAVAMKPGNLQRNDAFYIDQYRKLVESIRDPEQFARYFPDEAILNAVTNNNVPIGGLELATREVTDADGNTHSEQYWKSVNYQDVDAIAATDPARATELRKNFIKHNYMKKAIISLIGGVNRQMTPEVLSSLKPGAVPALKKLGATLKDLGLWTLNPDTPFEERINGDENIFAIPDSQDICRSVKEAQDEILRKYGIVSNPQRQNQQHHNHRPSSNKHRQVDLDDLPDDFVGDNYLRQQHRSGGANRQGINNLSERLARDASYRERNNLERITTVITDYFMNARQARSLQILLEDLTSYFSEVERLRDETVYSQFTEIISRYQHPPHAQSTEEAIAQNASPYDAYEADMIDALEQEITNLINNLQI